MGEETWRRLSNRLRQTVTNRQEEEEGRYPVKQFLPNGDQNFDGILKFLLTESNGNISEKVGMTASSNLDSLIIVTQYDNNSCYQSYNEQNPWICFDFKDKKNNSNKLPNEVLLRRSFILLSSEELDRWRIKRQQSMGNYCNRKQLFLPQWIFQLFYVFNFLTILEFKVLLLMFHIQVLIHQTVYEDF